MTDQEVRSPHEITNGFRPQIPNTKAFADGKEEVISLRFLKQNLIDNYINLLRIKAAETAINKELDIQIEVVKMKLTSYSIDTAQIEKMFFEAK